MEEVFRVLASIETWVYLILGMIGLLALRGFISAWGEWRSSYFGLERESVLPRLRTSISVLVFVILLILGEFVLVTFVTPNMPQAAVLATPTIDLLATTTPTLPGTRAVPTTTPSTLLQTMPVTQEGCLPGKIEWTFPRSGGQLKGSVVLKGTVNVTNLGFYKYEYSTTGSNNWITIAAGNRTVIDDAFGSGGTWNTSQLIPGDYRLRLVVADSNNQTLPACVINVRVVSP